VQAFVRFVKSIFEIPSTSLVTIKTGEINYRDVEEDFEQIQKTIHGKPEEPWRFDVYDA